MAALMQVRCNTSLSSTDNEFGWFMLFDIEDGDMILENIQ
ncbi:predicted protein [Sclerotinia sclerotiorum 1980 UF-70]|uniref:Uncharacterized protein n=1 Tax=Sclerotinia sclerotiorum (strain ATCC 18683 / 1980 / Ss-1) TaxID=665079 RepID=A7F920_SCLS1|nr:predicted protein [Sclerotinia sclerotiorum 1980 UF-70]EDN99241.1 predicted protein [Sclerotinia sclerotiorum 1980 UF-70]